MGGRSSECSPDGLQTLEFSLWVPWRVSDTFELLADVRNLNRLTPAWFDLQVLSREPVRPRLGKRIDYRLRWRGLPLRWQSVITVWQWPERIVYEQGRGPYRFFNHEHLFISEASGTRVIDRVAFKPPLGRLTGDLILAPELRRIFRYRKHVLEQLERPVLA